MVNFKFVLQNSQLPTKREQCPCCLKLRLTSGTIFYLPERIETAMSKVFLTARDDFSDSLPDYWKSCVNSGLTGRAERCVFSQEVLAVPGVASSGKNYNWAVTMDKTVPFPSTDKIFRVGNGISPPKATYQPEPEFSERARQAKFQGVVMLGLIVDRDGVPRRIRILSPLGAGLDEKAVHAVETWKFEPAKKDGEPVAVEIAVEIDFHLY
jgi:TonB family protein